MSGDKLALAKRAVEIAVDRLLPTDRFAVVCYDDEVDVVVEGTHASPEAKGNALGRLRRIDARGATDLGGGWLRGAEQVATALVEHGINRVLLLTDGLANRGITDPSVLTRHAGELRSRGVTTTTFGVGADFDETLLQSMADAGGGHFYFIEDARQIEDHIVSEVGELLAVVARAASLEITAPDSLEISALSPFPVERRGSRHFVLLGDLVAKQELEVVLRVRFPYGAIGEEVGILVAATDQEGVLMGPGAQAVGVGWEFADDQTNDRQDRDRTVDRAVAQLFAARARQEAATLNQSGNFAAAVGSLQRVAERIGSYAGDDERLREIAASLRGEEAQWSQSRPRMLLRRVYAESAYAMRSRSATGRARRRPSA